jgi:hypothetical protein
MLEMPTMLRIDRRASAPLAVLCAPLRERKEITTNEEDQPTS